MILKENLDELVKMYETFDFIKDDPIQFPHRYQDREDIEIAGFIASCFSYGNRKIFISKLNELFNLLNNKPYNSLMNFDLTLFKNFNYRFSKAEDVILLLNKISDLYKKGSSLQDLFKENYNGDLIKMMQGVCDYFYENAKLSQGYCHLISNPKNKGAMKRLNMFLRWMIRKSDVDLGVWNFILPSELLIPLDTHVARISRELGLLTRKSNDMKSVFELTSNLKKFDYNDPVKYDFAMFGYGITHPLTSQKQTADEEMLLV